MKLHPNGIAGDWVDGPDAADNINLFDTRDVLGVHGRASAAQAREAVAAAQAARPRWAGSTPQQRADALDAIGRSECARLAFGGGALSTVDGKPGCCLQPARFIDTHNGMRINREEIFGPVAAVIRVRDAEEALSVANNTDVGLSSGVCTSSLKWAAHDRRYLQAGMVMVNAPTAGVDPHLPFGGRKASSFGPREQGRHAAEFYTTVKTAYLAP